MDKNFFSMSEARQPVNQWLCIAFISLFCFWVVLYYFTEKAYILGESYVSWDTVFSSF
ncbi:MAG: hypothetical protein WCS89_02025 [Candidatus Paceibacterota bacterium]